jgi:hypothetical protein
VNKLVAFARLLVLGGSVGVILASCGSGDAKAPEASPTQTRSNPYTSPIRTEGSSPARLSGDGRYFGSVRAVDATSKPPTVTFDIAQFFFGKDVQKAAEEDGAVEPGEPVSNDHYARDPDAEARTLKVSTDAQVTAAFPVSRLAVPPEARARCQSGCTDAIPVTLADFFASFEKKSDRGSPSPAGGPFWLTIRDGLVVRIDEQYFP